jgi:hypothetical protein
MPYRIILHNSDLRDSIYPNGLYAQIICLNPIRQTVSDGFQLEAGWTVDQPAPDAVRSEERPHPRPQRRLGE